MVKRKERGGGGKDETLHITFKTSGGKVHSSSADFTDKTEARVCTYVGMSANI